MGLWTINFRFHPQILYTAFTLSLPLSLMSTRVGSVIGWICASLVALFTLFSAALEFMPVTDPVTAAFVEKLGITGMGLQLGITKIIITLLYLFPRTSTVGFVLIIGYYGGALATNITHGFTFMDTLPIYVVFALLTISAWFRNPELLARLRGKTV